MSAVKTNGSIHTYVSSIQVVENQGIPDHIHGIIVQLCQAKLFAEQVHTAVCSGVKIVVLAE